jgi:hypothetical protein
MCPGHSLSNGEERKNEKEGEKDIHIHVCMPIYMTDAAAWSLNEHSLSIFFFFLAKRDGPFLMNKVKN